MTAVPDSAAPRTAMVLAAGLATRMRPLTDHTAKPLLQLGGAALLDHALDRLARLGVARVAVNAHWQADRVAAHLAERAARPPATTVLHEPALLDTGGGVHAALPVLGAGPFLVLNGDAFWLDGPRPALPRLVAAWGDDVDAVLLVQRTVQIAGEVGRGDFFVDPLGYVRRRAGLEVAPYLFAGVQLASAALFDGAPDGAFSMNVVWDRAMARGRVRAVVHDGLWFHLSTPDDLREAEHRLGADTTSDTR